MESLSFLSSQRMQKTKFEWDKSCPGLGIRFNTNGTKVFLCRIHLPGGKYKEYTLGPIDVIRPNDARELVSRMKLIAKSGGLPDSLYLEFLKSAGIANCPDAIKFSTYVDHYIENYAKVYKKSWLKDKQRIDRYLMPEWGSRDLGSITYGDFMVIFKKLTKDEKKIAANRLKETATTLFKQAIISGHLPSDHKLPTDGVRKHAETPRREKLEPAHVPRLLRAIKNYPDPIYRNAFLLIIFLGLRHSECKQLRWDWFDFDAQVLTIKKTKNKRPHRVPITPSLCRLVKSFEKTNSPYVFPSPVREAAHIARLDKAWEKIRTEAGLPELRIHDLRRTFGCMILDQTRDRTMVRDLLNHTDQHITAVYGFYDNYQMSPVLEKHGAKLLDMLEDA